MLEHLLQAAWFLQRKGARSAFIAAALLHNLGHLLHTEGEDMVVRGVDTRHEVLGVYAFGDRLPASVPDPIRLHIAAKRSLCFAEPASLAALPPASPQRLALEGGPMSAAEPEGFLSLAHPCQTITLRRADNTAKMSHLKVPTLESTKSRRSSSRTAAGTRSKLANNFPACPSKVQIWPAASKSGRSEPAPTNACPLLSARKTVRRSNLPNRAGSVSIGLLKQGCSIRMGLRKYPRTRSG